MPEVDANTKIGDLVAKHKETLAVFERHGMNCRQCLAMAEETIEGAATMHSLDLDQLIDEIEAAIGQDPRP